MDLPAWVRDEIARYEAPKTGRVTIMLERYMGGVTRLEIGAATRRKPPSQTASVRTLQEDGSTFDPDPPQ